MVGKRLRFFVKPMTGEKISFLSKQIFVFSDGRCFDNSRKRFVAQCEHNGYLAMNLRSDNGRHIIYVHNLVASCYIRPLEKGVNVHHVNHVRTDNRIENLKIISASEHSKMHSLENWENGTFDGVAAQASDRAKKAWETGRMDGVGEKLKKAWKTGRMDGVSKKLRNVGTSRPAKSVAQLDMDGRLLRVWPSTRECQRNGFDNGKVAACCNGKRYYKTHKGYKWQWYDQYIKSQQTPKEQWQARQTFLDFSEQ